MKTLIIIAIIYFIFSVLMKKKPKPAGQPQPAPPPRRRPLFEEPEEAREDSETPWTEPMPPDEKPAPAPATATPAPEPSAKDVLTTIFGPGPVEPEPAPLPPASAEELRSVLFPAEPVAVVPPTAELVRPEEKQESVPHPAPRRRLHLTPLAAREGIILAEVLGPCLANRQGEERRWG